LNSRIGVGECRDLRFAETFGWNHHAASMLVEEWATQSQLAFSQPLAKVRYVLLHSLLLEER
jgi:hypothetical protein